MKISIISSSVREGRESHKAALAVQNELQKASDAEVSLIDLKAFDLPRLSHVMNKFPEIPAPVEELGRELDQADGIIFVSPEYNGGYSSALKNAIDFYPKSTYQRKPIGIVTASSGNMGGMRASQQLLHLALALWAIPSPQLLLVPRVQDKLDDSGGYQDPEFEKQVQRFAEHYLWLARKLTKREDQP